MPAPKVLVRVGDAAIVLFLEFVLWRVRSGIATQPELLDELVTLFVVGQLLERRELFRRDDLAHVFVQPLLVGGAQLLLERLGVFLLLLALRSRFSGSGWSVARSGQINVGVVIILRLSSPLPVVTEAGVAVALAGGAARNCRLAGAPSLGCLRSDGLCATAKDASKRMPASEPTTRREKRKLHWC